MASPWAMKSWKSSTSANSEFQHSASQPFSFSAFGLEFQYVSFFLRMGGEVMEVINLGQF
jgi:hypothetical protein